MFHFLPGLDRDVLYYKVQTAGFSSNSVQWCVLVFFNLVVFWENLNLFDYLLNIRSIFRLTRTVVGAKIKIS